MSAADPPQAVPAGDLSALALEPNWADAEPDARHCLIVDLDAGAPLPAGHLEPIVGWLRSQSVPVIGLHRTDLAPGAAALAGAPILAGAMDLLVSGEAELQRALRSIDQAPLAAGVLAQVLRIIPSLDPLAGLTLESLAYATLQGGSEFAAWLRGRDVGGEPPRPAGAAPLLLHRVDDRLEIVLNSPETRNALSVALRDALTEAFKLVAMDATIRQVHVSANGPCFSAGGELAEFGTRADPAAAHRIRMLRNPARYLAQHGSRYHFHVHRACIGAGILVAGHAMPFWPAVAACMAGIFSGDILLYLGGRWIGQPVIRRIPFRWLVREADVIRCEEWFRSRGPLVILASRFTPGTVT